MYNTVQELHIAFDEALQYIASNRKYSFRPEEKDWLLNETQYRIIDNIINVKKRSGYDDDQIQYDALKPLKTEQVLPVLIDETDKGHVILPANYLHRDRADVYIGLTCDNEQSIDTAACCYWSVCIPELDLKENINYNNFTIQLYCNETGTILYSIPHSLVPIISNNAMRYLLILDILNHFNGDNRFNVFYEYYNDIYKPGCLIFVDNIKDKDVDCKCNIAIASDYIELEQFVSISTECDIFKKSANLLKPTTLVSTEYITDLLVDSFGHTVKDKPLTTLQENRLYVYWNTPEFIVTDIKLSYIRKPTMINSLTNTMTELKNISDRIVQETVQNIKAKLNDANYQPIINENLLNN